jgi:hypothetical protein
MVVGAGIGFIVGGPVGALGGAGSSLIVFPIGDAIIKRVERWLHLVANEAIISHTQAL